MIGYSAVGMNAVGMGGSSTVAPVTSVISATFGASLAVGYNAAIRSANTSRISATLGLSQGAGFQAKVVSTTKIIGNLGVSQAVGYPATVTLTYRLFATRGTSQAVGYPASVVNLNPEIQPSWPDPAQVLMGVKYGPSGVEYTGTMVPQSGSSYSIEELVSAIWASPQALNVAKFQSMK